MSRGRVIKVECRCGQRLFKYFKGGRGRLIKCFLDQIRQDNVGLVDAPLGARPTCPGCGKELGIVRIIRGRPACLEAQPGYRQGNENVIAENWNLIL